MVPFTLFQHGELEKLIKDVEGFPLGETLDMNGMIEFTRDRTEGCLPFMKVSTEDINEDDFRAVWGLGEPLVLTNCLDRFRMSWTPEHFIQNYGEQQCMLFNCKTDKIIPSTVGSFFQEFLTTEPKRPLKLKVPPNQNLLKV